MEKFITQLLQLVNITRAIAMKNALTIIEPEPKLNFWRLIHGNQLDVAVLEWCKVFGTNTEATHWKKVVPNNEHDQYRIDLFTSCRINKTTWINYWQKNEKI